MKNQEIFLVKCITPRKIFTIKDSWFAWVLKRHNKSREKGSQGKQIRFANLQRIRNHPKIRVKLIKIAKMNYSFIILLLSKCYLPLIA